MCNIEYRLITTNDIPLMTDLLLERQKFECEVFSFLNNSCLNKEYIAKRLEDLFVKSKAIGVGAYINDEMVGYILSEMKVDTRKGRYAIIPYEGIAIKFDQPSELIRNLYAKIAVLWLEKGCFIHFAYIPLANKTYYDAFLRLSFAIEQVHAVLKIDDYVPFNQKTEMKVRLANKEDGELMGRMSSIISRFQNSTPVFSPAFPEVIAKIKENFIKLVQDESEVVFIAESNEKELGFLNYEISSPNLMIPDKGVELSVAGVYQSEMRSGVGKIMMNESCKVMKEKGYTSIKTDWRITNIASSNFWPKCGFQPIAYRMGRYIDSNYSWAKFNNKNI